MYTLPKHLDEKVARLPFKIGVELDVLSPDQAKVCRVAVEDPFKQNVSLLIT